MNNSKKTLKGWQQVDDLVQRWRRQRKQLSSAYQDVVSLKQYQASDTPVCRKVSNFCQSLVDYVSAGHFEIYNKLIEEAREFNDGSIDLVSSIFEKIESSTDYALNFNDKYDNDDNCQSGGQELPREMTKLGRVLELRFELEDLLIEVLHSSHRDQVA